MPTYQYRCVNCGFDFEVKQHFDDENLVICPECNQRTLEKVITLVPVFYKGKGFYSTDSRRSKNETND